MASKILFKDGKMQFSDTGKILFTPAAGSASDCACCGGCTPVTPGDESGWCDDVTPSQYQVTFSDIVLCPCVDSGGSSFAVELSEDINSVFTLNKDVGVSRWSHRIINGYISRSYPTTGCGGTPTTFRSDIDITLIKDSTTWRLTVSGSIFAATFVTANTDVGGNQLCATVPVMDNELTDDTFCLTEIGPSATGGTATVVCL